MEILKRVKKNKWYVGNVDFFNIPTKEKLAEKIIEATIQNKVISTDKIINAAKRGFSALLDRITLKQITNDGMEIILTFSDSKTDIDSLLDDSFDFPENFSKKHGARMCFAYDEFGDITKMNGELIKKMRAKFQLQKNSIYLFSGSSESLMNEIFIDKSGAFYGFCYVFELGPIPNQDFKDYISKSFKQVKIKLSSGVIDSILKLTKCHPYYTQCLCKIIYLNIKDKGKLDLNDIKSSFEQILALQQTYLDGVWSRLKHDSMLQLRICLHIVGKKDVSVYSSFDDSKQNIHAALQALIRKGIIKRSDEGYYLVDPLFEEYLLRKEL